MAYSIYLRKSRADMEAEARGEGETLARHEKALLELSARLALPISDIYSEVESGDTIASRPVMQRLLSDVEQGVWDGVFVMDVDRLARGDTIDQGIVAQTFKYSNTKIITPGKTYDPSNEYDEEYFEFGLFMARREYKTINRRLQRGRRASVTEGKFVGNVPPYGYERRKLENDKGFTLRPLPDQAEVVKLIYTLYTHGEQTADGTFERIGISKIAKRLNGMGIPTQRGNGWTMSSIRDILINPAYMGKVRWNWRPAKKKMVNGELRIERPRSQPADYVLADGLHEPIVRPETWQLAQDYMAQNPPRPMGDQFVVKNPLAGLVYCAKCGRSMSRRPYGPSATCQHADTLICAHPSCDTVASDLSMVEERILASLTQWLADYKLHLSDGDGKRADPMAEVKRKALRRAEKELATLIGQQDNVYDLLEQGVYDTATFLDRSKSLAAKIAACEADMAKLTQELDMEGQREAGRKKIIPKVERLLDVYGTLQTAKEKNDMLKEILEKVTYTKDVSARGRRPDDFEVVLYPKLPSRG